MILFLIWIVISITVSLTNLAAYVKVFIILFLFSYLVIRQVGYYHFSRAKKEIQRGHIEEAKLHIDKALSNKLSSTAKLDIERLLFSIDEYQKAAEVLESLIHDCFDPEIKTAALGDYATIKWKLGKIDEAIQILEDMREHAIHSDNFIINLSTLYLEKGRIEDAAELLKDIDRNSSFGLIDNKIECNILLGKWNEAEELSEILFPTDHFPRFPEAFLHRALIMVHKGRIEDAVLLLTKSQDLTFSQYSLLSRDYLKKIAVALEDKIKRKHVIDIMLSDTHNLFTGRLTQF